MSIQTQLCECCCQISCQMRSNTCPRELQEPCLASLPVLFWCLHLLDYPVISEQSAAVYKTVEAQTILNNRLINCCHDVHLMLKLPSLFIK